MNIDIEETVKKEYELIGKENYGNNACIKLGFYHGDCKDPGIP